MLRLVVSTVVYTILLCCQLAWTFPPQTCNHQPGRCTLVSGIDHGSEDIQVLPNGLAFVTSGLDPKTPGNIFLFDFKKPRRGAHALDIVGDLDRVTFSPHGLSIWKDTKRNIVFIFVVNHNGNNKETVEKFRFDARRRKLYHVKTYQDDRTFIYVNDLVVTGKDSFYFTSSFKFDFVKEVTRRLRLSSVGFYDGTRGRIMLKGLFSQNGINISPNGRYLYLSEFGGERLNIYARNRNTLQLLQVVPMCSFVDNIDVDVATGDLWVASHPDFPLLMKYLYPPHTAKSPSQVFRLTMCDGGSRVSDVEEVYYNDGQQFTGSTVAVHYRGLMVIGSVHTNMLVCNIRHT